MELAPVSNQVQSFTRFGDFLRYLRRRARLTQLELSIRVGYSEAQISRLEQHQRLPDVTSVRALFIPALDLEGEPPLATRLLALAQSARQEDAPSLGLPPYKGLLFFDEPDAELFYGRETLIARLANHVVELAMNSFTRFLTVVGASGSGKSSLVRAGLAVALKCAGWDVRVVTPTANPIKVLEMHLNPARLEKAQRILLLVDQFEELFTLCHDELERIAFIEKLLAWAREESRTITVVVALRADFYAHCAQYPSLRQVIAAEQEYIGQMTREELRRVIEEPARLGGWEFENGLVDILLQDVGALGLDEPEPGALPLLSHALLATWERRRGRTFTIEGYRASGGVCGAIAQTAESVFTDRLNRTQQDMARNIFLRLTELGEGMADTCRRVTLLELTRKPEQAAELRLVLNTLAEARLITLNEDSAEIAHEALIREWTRLHSWINQDREDLRQHQHLTEAAREWNVRGQDPAELYRGARLDEAREWALRNEERLNIAERSFLVASADLEQRSALEREAHRQRELEAAQRLAKVEQRRAEEQTQFAHQMRRRAHYLAVAFILSLVMAGVALSFSNQSDQNARAALNARATAVANADTAVRFFNALIGRELLPLSGHPVLSSITAYSPDRKMVAAERGDEIIVWDAESGQPLFTLVEGIDRVSGMEFSPDGTRLINGNRDGTAIIWDLTSGKVLFTLQEHSNAVESVAFSPDGTHVATASDDGTAIIWNATTGSPALTLLNNTAVRCVAYSPDGTRIATADFDGTANIWDASTGGELLSLRGHSAAITSVAFSPDGELFATASIDGTAKIWNASTGDILYEITR